MTDKLAEIEARWGDVITVHCCVGGEPGDCVCNLGTEAAQAIRWLIGELQPLRAAAEHALKPHVRITGPVSFPIEGWVECEQCKQVTFNTSSGVGGAIACGG